MHHVYQLYAFGSLVNKGLKESSDVDLIVNFDTIKIKDYADNYFAFKYSLEAIFTRPVDLLEEKALKNPYFNKLVEKQRQLVYG
jgi:predicted nucleotidyltransferase